MTGNMEKLIIIIHVLRLADINAQDIPHVGKTTIEGVCSKFVFLDYLPVSIYLLEDDEKVFKRNESFILA